MYIKAKMWSYHVIPYACATTSCHLVRVTNSTNYRGKVFKLAEQKNKVTGYHICLFFIQETVSIYIAVHSILVPYQDFLSKDYFHNIANAQYFCPHLSNKV